MALAEVTKDNGRKNTIGDFFVDAVSSEVMLEFIKEHELEDIDTTGSAEALAVALSMHFKSTTSKADLCKCTECSGESPITLEACPFCGDAEELEEGEGDDDDDDSSPIVEEGEEQNEPIDRDGEDEPSALVSPPESHADAGETTSTTAEPSSKPKKAKEKNNMELVQTNGASKKGASSKSITKGTVTNISARELDKVVEEVKKIKADGAVSYWTLGKKILEINERGLWKLRSNDDGKAAYKSFEQFVHHELNMSASYAYAAVDVAREYKTADEVRALGSKTKAMLVLKVPAQDRPKVIEQAGNMTTKQIRDAAKESRAKHGSPKKNKQQASAGAKGATSPKRESKNKDKVTAVRVEGTRTVKLHKRPDNMKGLDAAAIAQLPRAKKLTDQPIGIVEGPNGAIDIFEVLQKDGDLVLKWAARRK